MTKPHCAGCGMRLIKKSNAQKYCKSCAYIKKLETARKFSVTKRKKDEGTLGPHPIKNNDGTINIKAEQRAIIKEMKRLGLRKK